MLKCFRMSHQRRAFCTRNETIVHYLARDENVNAGDQAKSLGAGIFFVICCDTVWRRLETARVGLKIINRFVNIYIYGKSNSILNRGRSLSLSIIHIVVTCECGSNLIRRKMVLDIPYIVRVHD